MVGLRNAFKNKVAPRRESCQRYGVSRSGSPWGARTARPRQSPGHPRVAEERSCSVRHESGAVRSAHSRCALRPGCWLESVETSHTHRCDPARNCVRVVSRAPRPTQLGIVCVVRCHPVRGRGHRGDRLHLDPGRTREVGTEWLRHGDESDRGRPHGMQRPFSACVDTLAVCEHWPVGGVPPSLQCRSLTSDALPCQPMRERRRSGERSVRRLEAR